jgi:hypothetical protein
LLSRYFYTGDRARQTGNNDSVCAFHIRTDAVGIEAKQQVAIGNSAHAHEIGERAGRVGTECNQLLQNDPIQGIEWGAGLLRPPFNSVRKRTDMSTREWSNYPLKADGMAQKIPQHDNALWQDLFRTALLESDAKQLKARIEEAERAITARFANLGPTSASEETQKMMDAMLSLAALRRELKGEDAAA